MDLNPHYSASAPALNIYQQPNSSRSGWLPQTFDLVEALTDAHVLSDTSDLPIPTGQEFDRSVSDLAELDSYSPALGFSTRLAIIEYMIAATNPLYTSSTVWSYTLQTLIARNCLTTAMKLTPNPRGPCPPGKST